MDVKCEFRFHVSFREGSNPESSSHEGENSSSVHSKPNRYVVRAFCVICDHCNLSPLRPLQFTHGLMTSLLRPLQFITIATIARFLYTIASCPTCEWSARMCEDEICEAQTRGAGEDDSDEE